MGDDVATPGWVAIGAAGGAGDSVDWGAAGVPAGAVVSAYAARATQTIASADAFLIATRRRTSCEGGTNPAA
jgi:hypothetical protein